MGQLQLALNHDTWISHERNHRYTVDGKGIWALVYYPIFECGKTGDQYNEPRALMHDTTKDGFWSKEMPLRYIERIKTLEPVEQNKN